MLRVISLVLALGFATPALVHAKMADVSCDDSARIYSTLKNEMGAERQATGLRDPETVLEVWVKRRNGEWVIVQNYTNGTSCIVAMGEHWEVDAHSPS